MIRCLLFCALLLPRAALEAQVTPKTFTGFRDWTAVGETNLFHPVSGGMEMTWDSSKPNSYLYLPLGMILTREDDFKLTFIVTVTTLRLGTTPGQPYTFEIGAGLINLTNALAPRFYRGAGIDREHGPRNIVEFDYFPASGIIAPTVAPTIATAENQILFSDNHPLEIELDLPYKVEMSFTAPDQTLRTKMWKAETPGNGLSFAEPPLELKPLALSSSYSGFAVNALALISYNDQGQNPPQFSGSVTATGLFSAMELQVFNRPLLAMNRAAEAMALSFETSPGWRYQLEQSATGELWRPFSTPLEGTGQSASVPFEPGDRLQIYRIRAERL
ncbi:MAG TPA: hypothetical protein VK633_01720 [Verrucomicrobiae bacterium]|nr:hypothetical protein [Verrucomicrobiae bacterium]